MPPDPPKMFPPPPTFHNLPTLQQSAMEQEIEQLKILVGDLFSKVEVSMLGSIES